MKVVIVGAGVVGVTTAYYLAKSGHQVTVVEKEPEAAMLASAGNAGLIAPGHSFAWASPTAPAELLRSLTVEDTALRINPLKAPGMALWGLKFLRECNAERSSKNTLVKLRLAQYSQRMLDQISADEHIDYDDIHEGLLYLYRDQKRFEAGVKKMKFLQDHGQKQDVLDPDGIVEAEPYFAPVKDKLAGAIYGVTDSSGDSVKFTRKLQEVCERMGSKFVVGKGVTRFNATAGKVQSVAFDDGESMGGDAFVLSAGVQSPRIARSVGVKLPIAPAKGYSATFPIKAGDGAMKMRIGCVDEELLVAWCRMGDKLRVTSSAEFTGYETTYDEHDLRLIRKLTHDLLPEAAEYDKGTYRACNRPMTPDGPPILGQAGPDNLFINSGHGHMGFTMACGSSKLVADVIDGKKTDIPIEGLTLTSRP
ncbi:MAG: FAD-dependent oxidoreductase [Chloroflexi bacterium]|nr:MAG: FAD-dependent oxidoreductase [Chloroflexota bacterium]TMG24962.1 MAG: FAD-dependent oxidoreductase [Chloroflexota bacterium]